MEKHKLIENHLSEEESKWFAVYVRYKREKIVEKDLKKKKIEVYLPINNTVRKWKSKTKKVSLPLIPCYLFVKIRKEEYVKVLENENVVTFVKFSDNLISIPASEIELLRKITGEFKGVELAKSELKLGDEVEIVGGAMTGLRGRLVSGEKRKLLIEFNNIAYNLVIEVEGSLVQKV